MLYPRLSHCLVMAVTLVLGCGVVWAGPSAQTSLQCASLPGAAPMVRTELLFGLARPGGVVSEAEFQQFIDDEVTPRFPQGLTLLLSRGQFKQADGNLVREDSRLLILLHPVDASRGGLIDEIRERYKSRFEQESVLRLDAFTCASF